MGERDAWIRIPDLRKLLFTQSHLSDVMMSKLRLTDTSAKALCQIQGIVGVAFLKRKPKKYLEVRCIYDFLLNKLE